MKPTKEQRFWMKVDKSGPVPAHRPELGNCWAWTGCRSGNRSVLAGYLAVRDIGKKRRMVKASRISYEIHFGKIPEKLWVLHKCDNGLCVNPAHLFLGDAAANSHDMISKGRQNFSGLGPNNKKLTPENVSEIRSAVKRFGYIKALMKKFSVSENTILRVRNKTSWSTL